MPSINTPLFILYGSATGNAEHIAKSLSEDAKQNSAWPPDQIHCYEANQFKKHCLSTWQDTSAPSSLLIVTSTTGNGDTPENADRFVRFLKRKTTSPTLFQNVTYSVLALGDTNYDQFCHCGKLVDKKLRELGGTACQKIACADEGTGLEAVVDPWTDSILATLAKAMQGDSSDGGEEKQDEKVKDTVTEASQTSKEEKSADEHAPNATAAAKSETLSSRGVKMLRDLLSLKDNEDIPTIDDNSLPGVAAKLSSCKLMDKDCTPPPTPHETEVVDEDEDFYYTADRPFASTIRQARYLTHLTSQEAAERVTQQLTSESAKTEWFARANEVYDELFPLDDPSLEKVKLDQNGKRVIEMTLALPEDHPFEYAPGDALGLLMENTPTSVAYVLNLLQKNQKIVSDQQWVKSDHFLGTVRDALTRIIDLSSTNPMQPRSLRAWAAYANDNDAKAMLYLASTTGRATFQTMIQEQRWNVVDLLQNFESLQPQVSMESLFALLPQIPPRYYSVSSSPAVSKNELTVTFAVVDYVTPALSMSSEDAGSRRIRGLATGYLELLCSPFLCNKPSGDKTTQLPPLRIFPKPTTDFRLPPSIAEPLILIGPGTGIAPFVGFLRHLSASEVGTSGKRPPIYLFFGCRHQAHDYLYREELQQYQEQGLITSLFTAFSRDGNGKKYVQDFMDTQLIVESIVDLKARVYLCGDGNQMAKDVQQKLSEILPEGHLEEMKRSKRFLLDIWS
eukprot:CAMPEP_0168740416 /NCGR_PEP_ID=MMETSP0724-20121128/11972_1 /TAXON_ID=265536 /ORGANISM="Amphiprora sp., Strain CCMP467" /LENGTH=733 /DNA_ID=CAMNT_0008787859 /DNA_START=59 /DNA_END=2260 /DNA_ORIENTATION=+